MGRFKLLVEFHSTSVYDVECETVAEATELIRKGAIHPSDTTQSEKIIKVPEDSITHVVVTPDMAALLRKQAAPMSEEEAEAKQIEDMLQNISQLPPDEEPPNYPFPFGGSPS
jgi:hypothetical protein